jgi:(4S)-4-hydroxy-5-phosphonooxypentane-2,3-dione isomerase
MYVVCVSIHVKEAHAAEFVEATLDNARHTRLEPGNLRFDVLRQEQDPNRFTLYEAYRTPADFVAHQRTGHYLRWKETVADWMAGPRVGVKHHSVFPDEAGW